MALPKIGHYFVAMPQEIWDKNIPFSLPEFRLYGYLLRHQVRFKSTHRVTTFDELLKGTWGSKNGVRFRVDTGCGLSRNSVKSAIQDLKNRGWISVVNTSDNPQLPSLEIEVLLSQDDIDCQTMTVETVTPRQSDCQTVTVSNKEVEVVEGRTNTTYSNDQIETIYQAYPRKVAHAPALKAIRKALEGIEKSSKSSPGEVFEWLLWTVRAYASSAAGQRQTGTDYRPHPATWFNAERYFDDPQELNKIGGKANGRVESNKEALRIALERIASQTEGSDCDEVDGDDQLQSGNSQPGLFGDHVNSTIEGKR